MSPVKKKHPAKKSKTASPQGSGSLVRVRMYDVGFGDGFVLFFPDGDGFRTVVLDCGSIRAGKAGPIEEVAKRIVADIEKETGKPRVDVVIATHRHKDHVSGFASEVWSNVDVGEVWLPWTEDPVDPEATRIRESQASLAIALSGSGRGSSSFIVDELTLNALSNARAMETLHRGFRTRDVEAPRFLPDKDRAKATFKSPFLPGVLVRVLGPSRIEAVIRDMDPPSGESYLAAMRWAQTRESNNGKDSPFEARLSRAAYRDSDGTPLDAQLEARLRTAGMPDELDLAAALESAVNGTSLMLMLDVGRVRLLLPGDAQWGTWKAALDDPEWGALFSQTSFYKIGHHGSHNATPIRFVDQNMPTGVRAMASVTPVSQWKNIPRAPLLAALAARKAAVARSDQPEKAASSSFRRAEDDAWIETWLQV